VNGALRLNKRLFCIDLIFLSILCFFFYIFFFHILPLSGAFSHTPFVRGFLGFLLIRSTRTTTFSIRGDNEDQMDWRDVHGGKSRGGVFGKE